MRELERHELDTNGATFVHGGTMKLVRTVAELRCMLGQDRCMGRSIGLVPTMGVFHDGHLCLIRRAWADCDVVVVSFFVNFAQFVSGEDLASYSCDEACDVALFQQEGVDVFFVLVEDEVYFDGIVVTVEVPDLASVLCGALKRRGPEHFRGVATVVTKFFNMVQPEVVYFGQKDYQQTLVIKCLV